MKLKKIFCTLALSALLVSPVWAGSLPQDVMDYIMQQYPKATIRFDSLIVLPDGTEYLPIIPSITDYNAGMNIKSAVPATKSLKSKPDIVVFDNNFALLKIIKGKNDTRTVKKMKDYPIEIKTGMLPQELIVPHGLVLPEELQGILGNLEIPLEPMATVLPVSQQVPDYFEIANAPEEGKMQKLNNPKTTVLDVKQPAVLKGKRYLVTNLNSEYISIIPSYASDPKFTLRLDSIPLDMAITQDEAFLLISKINNTNIDLVDIRHEQIIKKIDLEVQPNEILITPDNRVAYITSLSDRSIFILDLPNMKIVQKIKVQGMPEKLALSNDNSKLLYYDKMSSKVYCLELGGRYISTLVDKYPNASKFIYANDRVYAILRQSDELSIKNYVPPEFSGEEKSVKNAEAVRLKQQKEGVSENENRKNNSSLMGSTDTLDFANPQSKASSAKEPKHTERYYDKNEVMPLMVQNDTADEEEQYKIKLDKKPVDMVSYGDYIYVLTTQDKIVDIVDIKTASVVGSIQLPIKGFPKKITQVKNSNIALITNVADNSYVVFDMAKGQIVDVHKLSIPINNILVIQDI